MLEAALLEPRGVVRQGVEVPNGRSEVRRAIPEVVGPSTEGPAATRRRVGDLGGDVRPVGNHRVAL